jgi:hypothetical protein
MVYKKKIITKYQVINMWFISHLPILYA